MLGVDEHPLTFGTQMRHRVPDHRQVLGERGAQGPLDVAAVGFRDQADDVGSGLPQGCDLGVVGGCAPGTAGGAERGEGGVVQAELGSGAAEELGILGIRPGPAALDEAHAYVVEVAGYRELVADRQRQALLLGPVTQRRVIDVEGAWVIWKHNAPLTCGSGGPLPWPLWVSRVRRHG